MYFIKPADISHLDILCDFQKCMAFESEGATLSCETLKSGIKSVLTDFNKGRYFIAEENGVVVGCLMITYEWSDWRNGWIWWIQSVYVRKDMRRKGVFKAMYNYIKNDAVGTGVKGLRLYADRNNHIAHKTYEKMGMNSEHYITFEWLL